ncbi:MAG TPA: hypothetical protein VLL52_16900 [Anaerolineae bacterium]|nr:hypothetical protein [Anaerolineae bacterium]
MSQASKYVVLIGRLVSQLVGWKKRGRVDEAEAGRVSSARNGGGDGATTHNGEASEAEEDETAVYIEKLELEDMGSWTKESQEAYVRARLKQRENMTEAEKKDDFKQNGHWDLF